MENKAMDISREQLRKMADAGSYEAAVALAKEMGIGIDEELDAHIKAYFEKKAGKQISDEELDNVAGGKINWGNGLGTGYVENQDDVRFAFNIGDEVEVWKVFWTERGIIKDRKIQKGMYDPWSQAIDIWPPSNGYVPVYYVEFFKRCGPSWEPQDCISY